MLSWWNVRIEENAFEYMRTIILIQGTWTYILNFDSSFPVSDPAAWDGISKRHFTWPFRKKLILIPLALVKSLYNIRTFDTIICDLFFSMIGPLAHSLYMGRDSRHKNILPQFIFST